MSTEDRSGGVGRHLVDSVIDLWDRIPLAFPARFPEFVFWLFLCLFWVSWLASFEHFNSWINLAIAVLIAAATWRLVRPARNQTTMLRGVSRTALVILLVLLLFVALTTAFFFHDTFFDTRDDGIYASNAAYLAREGKLPFPQVEGRSVRHYGNTVWSAQWFGMFGYQGLKLASIIPLCMALLCIFLLVNDLTGREAAGLMAATILALSYPVVWFSRRTVNEIIFLSLFWIAVYFLYRVFTSEPARLFDILMAFLTFPLLAFIRLEGIVVAAVAAAAAVVVGISRWRKSSRRAALTVVIASMVLVCAAGAAFGLYLSNKQYGKLSETVGQNIGRKVAAPPQALLFHESAYSAFAMIKFGYMPAILLVIPLFVFLLLDARTRKFAVFLLLMSLPFFYFFFRPNIAFDFPWFLRRFVTVVIPLGVIALCYLAFKLKWWQGVAITSVFLALTLFISAPIIFQRDYAGMITQAGKVASVLPDDAKVIVDRYALDDYGISYPLYFVFGKDTMRVTPWEPAKKSQLAGRREVYFVTNTEFFEDQYARGARLFAAPVRLRQVDEVARFEVAYKHLEPTCEFHRGYGALNWKFIDYRVALARIEVPGTFVTGNVEVVVFKIQIEGT